MTSDMMRQLEDKLVAQYNRDQFVPISIECAADIYSVLNNELVLRWQLDPGLWPSGSGLKAITHPVTGALLPIVGRGLPRGCVLLIPPPEDNRVRVCMLEQKRGEG